MKKQLLVIDDDPAIRGLVRRAFSGPDCEVTEAADGADAAALVAEKRPDLVLLDLHMPRLDGIATLSEIRRRAAGTAVIMLTGDHDSRRAQLAMERGACDYITKPFDMQTLRTCVTTYLLIAS